MAEDKDAKAETKAEKKAAKEAAKEETAIERQARLDEEQTAHAAEQEEKERVRREKRMERIQAGEDPRDVDAELQPPEQQPDAA
jgi:hypothetical protein